MTASPRIAAARRLIAGVSALGLAGGAIGWVLLGEVYGSVGLWTLLGVGVLLFSAAIRALGAGGDGEP